MERGAVWHYSSKVLQYRAAYWGTRRIVTSVVTLRTSSSRIMTRHTFYVQTARGGFFECRCRPNSSIVRIWISLPQQGESSRRFEIVSLGQWSPAISTKSWMTCGCRQASFSFPLSSRRLPHRRMPVPITPESTIGAPCSGTHKSGAGKILKTAFIAWIT